MTVGENDGGENPRPISWIKAARKDFSKFPVKARQRMLTALEIAAAGQKADIAKRMKGLGAGVIEIALRYQTNAYRMIYALQLDQDILLAAWSHYEQLLLYLSQKVLQPDKE